MSRRRRCAPTAALGAGAAALSLLAGCHTPHPGLSNGSVSACYRAIPVARAAVHDKHAVMIGVHRLPADTVLKRLPTAVQAQLAKEDDTVVCSVAFRGRFLPGQVELAPPAAEGDYAIVLLTSRRLRLVSSFVVSRLPHALGKRTV